MEDTSATRTIEWEEYFNLVDKRQKREFFYLAEISRQVAFLRWQVATILSTEKETPPEYKVEDFLFDFKESGKDKDEKAKRKGKDVKVNYTQIRPNRKRKRMTREAQERKAAISKSVWLGWAKGQSNKKRVRTPPPRDPNFVPPPMPVVKKDA